MLKGRKPRPVRASAKRGWKDRRHGTRDFVSWRPEESIGLAKREFQASAKRPRR